MAEENETETEGSGGGKKKLIIIIAIVVILLAGGGAGAFFMMGGDEAEQTELTEDGEMAESSDEMEEGEIEGEAGVDVASAVYVPLPRPFRFNVPGEVRDRFAEIKVQLLVRGVINEETAKKHIPLIESTLLAVFSSTNVEELSTSEGKINLKQKALVDIQKIMKEVEEKEIVEKVLFTGFVMQ